MYLTISNDSSVNNSFESETTGFDVLYPTTTGNDFEINVNSVSVVIVGFNVSGNDSLRTPWKTTLFAGGNIQIPFYSIILLLAVVGNLLVISTLVQNRRMRTVTNLFLLNLAISDILLGVLCMPVTLVGTLLRHFIFGEFLCKLIPFLQATSVAVSSWTLVAISCERYCAICHPLRSRSWQTINHAYKIIGFIWLGSIVCMAPIAIFSQLMPTSQGLRKCRESWPQDAIVYERAYNILLDLILLVLPLIVLSAAYFLIIRKLYLGMKMERIPFKSTHTFENICMDSFVIDSKKSKLGMHPNIQSISFQCKTTSIDKEDEKKVSCDATQPNMRNPMPCHRSKSLISNRKQITSKKGKSTNYIQSRQLHESTSLAQKQFGNESILRKSNVAKNFESKKRVVKMLFVLVLEFFICWTPLYVINTIALFDASLIYENLGYTTISFLQLLAYSSSCCNPITYGFMNARFRRAFLDTFSGIEFSKKFCNKIKSSPTADNLTGNPMKRFEMQNKY